MGTIKDEYFICNERTIKLGLLLKRRDVISQPKLDKIIKSCQYLMQEKDFQNSRVIDRYSI